ncbi:electron transport complex subunit RsxC [Congregibacter sp.]|uniref:electron transport complex subunit RsxC n=1 Tax=Congregibacter sp. TaxID=2744308 RepID=UPI003F6B6BFA
MRRVHDFHGGIYPPERKTLSNSIAIRKAAIPKQLVLPLSQHIGPPAAAIVEAGQEVLGGERLTDLSGLPIHAPTSGVIAAIEERPVPHASGMLEQCIIINCDGEDRWVELRPVDDFRNIPPEALVQQIYAAGIAGLGGAGFPTARKLPMESNNAIDTLIINGTECEPYITSDDVLMRERADRIISGIEILSHIAQPSEILIGIEDNKPEAIAAFKLALNGREDMQVVTFPTKYPSGGEKQLIEILTGKQVPSGGLPSHIGILCQNVGSAAAIHDAIILGRPLVSRITTVTGESAAQRGNFDVLLGTPMQDLLSQAQYQPAPRQRLIMGGPMMGVTLSDHHCPIIKTTNCLLVPGETELPEPGAAQACIRCGLCAEVCPARLLPQQLYWFARAQDHERLEEHHLFDCIECGACSYACPSHIPLVQYYRASKAAVRAQKTDNAKADHARERFEARQERMARAAEEKEAKRAARKRAAMAKAADQAVDGDPIQAAIARAQARKAAQASAPADDQQLNRDKLAKIDARLAKARDKLNADDGSDPAMTAALANAVTTTEKKRSALLIEIDTSDSNDAPAVNEAEGA